MHSKLTRLCDGLLEAGWLVALILTPLFFNIHSERVFEPDKLAVLRSLALLMAAVWMAKWVAQRGWTALGEWDPRRPTAVWRRPLVLPVLLLAAVYLLSTALSVAPRTSFFGSYQRLQGTYSTLSYLVIFGVTATTLRTRAQLQRLVSVVVVTSIPVALYAMLQKFELDPLPWGGDTSTRVAGHMGNAIFIAAYLIMAIPLTAVRIVESFRRILLDETLAWADVVRASVYVLTLALQLLAVYWSQSRGPLLGLGVGMFAFVLILLVALRNAAPQAAVGRRAPAWVGPLVLVGGGAAALFLSDALGPALGAGRAFVLFGAAIVVLMLAIFVLAAAPWAGARHSWRWLWAGWIGLVVFLGAVLLLYNVAVRYPERTARLPLLGGLNDTFAAWVQLPTIGRLGAMLDSEAGTSQVRLLIWRGALELIAPHEPLVSPLGGADRFNALRPLIGYGPEAMYVAYNRFYPPELATVEARNASPDRSHNETFDALVITGALGFVAWQYLYLAVFYHGLRRLRVIRHGRDGALFVALWVIGALLGSVALSAYGGRELIGIAAPFGGIVGLVAYLVVYALTARASAADPVRPTETVAAAGWSDTLLLVGILAVVAAHYVEIHFGIAIAATRLYFFVLSGVLLALSSGALPADEAHADLAPPAAASPARSRRPVAAAPRPTGRGASLAAVALLLMLIVGTLGYDFINFTAKPNEMEGFTSVADLPSAADIIGRALLVNPRLNFAPAPYLYGLVALSWLLGAAALTAEAARDDGRGAPPRTGKAAGRIGRWPAWTPGVLLAAAGLIGWLAVLLPGGEATAATRIGGLLGLVWGALATAAAGLLLWRPDRPTLGQVAGGVALVGVLFSLPLLFAGSALYALAIGLTAGGALYLLWVRGDARFALPVLLVGAGSWVVGYVYMLYQAGLIRGSFIAPTNLTGLERVVAEATRIGGFLSGYYVFWIGIWLALGAALAWRELVAEKATADWPAVGALLVLGVLALWLVDRTNLNIVQADMTYKRGRPFDQLAGQLMNQLAAAEPGSEQARTLSAAALERWRAAVAVYEQAVAMAPNEDYYYLWLGRAYLEQTRVNPAEAATLLRTAEQRLQDAQRINPLNTDHTANLARLNTRWAGSAQGAEREERAQQAAAYYRKALELSPNNALIRNEYARLLFDLSADCDGAIAALRESVRIDPFYDRSYLLAADVYDQCARRVEPVKLTHYDDALQLLDDAFTAVPARRLQTVGAELVSTQFWLAQRLLDVGDPGRARSAAEAALVHAGADLAVSIRDFLETLPTP